MEVAHECTPRIPNKLRLRRGTITEAAHRVGYLANSLVGYGLILAVIWTPKPLQHWLYFIALGWFIVSIFVSFEGWKAMGCCVAGFWRSSWVVGVAMIMAAVATFFAGSLHTLHHPSGPVQWVRTFGGYTVWALTQQLLLQGYFLARLLRIVPQPNVAALPAATSLRLRTCPTRFSRRSR